MRQITITAPEGQGHTIARIAFASGVSAVAVTPKRILERDGSESIKDSVEIDAGTSVAKEFLNRLLSEPSFNRREYSISSRQPRSLVSSDDLRTLTRPLIEPSTDIFEELWQFSLVTFGFVGRILIGAFLLAYGLVEYQLLFIIAGLLFIPLLPLVLSISFGLWTQQWRLALQGVASLAIALLLLIIGGAVVGALTSPPVRYVEFNSLATGLLVSCAVGVAAGLATADDAGRREMIGLAATSQVAIIPAWFGLGLVLGFPAAAAGPLWQRWVALLVNIIAIVVASFIIYALLVKPSTLACFQRKPAESLPRHDPQST